MNNIITDVKNLELETLKNLKNSKSNNTLKAYQSDFKDFTAFCIKNGLSSMPTQPKIIALYITHLSKFSKFSTLKRRIASISVIHKLKGHYLDTKHPIIMENLHGIKRTLGSRQKAKKPLLINSLKKIIKAIDQEKKERDRDRALILIGFAGGFRRSELVSILKEDVELVDEGVKILIKKSKTDQSGEGSVKAIPYFQNQEFCPVLALKHYINEKVSKKNEDKVFEMSDKSVALIIKKYAQKAGLDPSRYAGHSFEFLDSPNTTSAITYGIKWQVHSGTTYLNRTWDANWFHGVSSVTAMEVSA